MENKSHTTRNRVSARNPVSGLWYPFLFAAYPALGLLAVNVSEARPEEGVRPVFIALALAALLLALFRLLLRDWYRAAFVTAAWMGLAATYGHVFLELQEAESAYAQHRLLGGAALLLGALALFAASRPRVRFEAWVGPLNVAALALVVFPLGKILWHEAGRATPDAYAHADAPIVEVEGTRPDIYYIVLDMYTRADTLRTAYGYDNSEFLGGLEAMGFDVAECAMSNYVRTELSLASSLNMTYLTSDVDPKITPENLARSPMWNLVRDNAAMEYARARGYKTVAFATGFPWSELDNADIYLEPDPLRGGLTEFESLWLQTTALRVLQDEGLVDTRYAAFNRYRERTRFVLDALPAFATMDEPTFVFAHIILPHPPFVFAEDGGTTDPVSYLNEKNQYPAEKFKAGYAMQVTFANREITRIVREIVANSETPPVIILQGDHGPWLQSRQRRMTILNAYYLPGHPDAIADFITPVNTFRLVFDLYLDGDFGLLQNASYYSPVPDQYNFQAISSKCDTR
ncbi:MAG: hypothetical protein AB1750_07550 [Chloroflexota bacterium]